MVNLTSLKHRETGGTGIQKAGFLGIQGEYNCALQVYVHIWRLYGKYYLNLFSSKVIPSQFSWYPKYFIIYTSIVGSGVSCVFENLRTHLRILEMTGTRP